MKNNNYFRRDAFNYLDLYNIYSQPKRNVPKMSGFAQDTQAIAGDWQVVGDTLRDIISKNRGKINIKDTINH